MQFKPIPFTHISDNVIKNVAAEIMRECKTKKGVELNADYASYAVCLLSLDPTHGLSQSTQFDRNKVQKFVNKCVTKLSISENIVTQIIKMQVEFMKQITDLRDVEKKYKAINDAKLEKLFDEITAFPPEIAVDFEHLLKKICTAIIVKCKLGKPSSTKVFEETMNALKSVISRPDLVAYVEMKKRHRQAYFASICQLVCGIRIFNKNSGQCDEGVRDIIADLILGFNNTQQNLTESLENAREIIKIGSTAMKFAIDAELKTSFVTIILPTKALKDELYNFNKYLLMFYQYEMFVTKLLTLLNNAQSNLEFHFENFRKVLGQIHEIVQFRIAVPTDMVFPHFIELSNIWNILLVHLYLMIEINKVNDKLTELINISYPGKEIGLQILEISKRLHRSKYSKDKPNVLVNELMPIKPETMKPIEKFCGYIFIMTKGLLLKSDSALGVMEYNNLKYGFNRREFASFFEEDIKESELQLQKLIHSNPEFIYFFDMFTNVQSYNLLSSQRDTEFSMDIHISKKFISMECQTEMHPIPSLINKQYFWNVWDVRREAIKIANLRKCLTRGAQTDLSYQRRDHYVQTGVPTAANDVQTSENQITETE